MKGSGELTLDGVVDKLPSRKPLAYAYPSSRRSSSATPVSGFEKENSIFKRRCSAPSSPLTGGQIDEYLISPNKKKEKKNTFKADSDNAKPDKKESKLHNLFGKRTKKVAPMIDISIKDEYLEVVYHEETRWSFSRSGRKAAEETPAKPLKRKARSLPSSPISSVKSSCSTLPTHSCREELSNGRLPMSTKLGLTQSPVRSFIKKLSKRRYNKYYEIDPSPIKFDALYFMIVEEELADLT
jgi:hypothetical protein